jgi:viroplasmin and RNaseH domain-containing protein
MAWYVVHVGRRPGVYSKWDDAHAQVNGYKGCCHKKFKTREEAFQAFYDGHYNEVKQIPSQDVALDVNKHCWCNVHRVIIMVMFLIIVFLISKLL